MPWITPDTSWVDGRIPSKDDFNRIEANTQDLNNNKLGNSGEGKDVIVTFVEGTDAEIASGETLATMFGKLLKKLKNINTNIANIINGITAVGSATTANSASKLATARTINGVSFDGTANITVADSTKAPTSHASSATTYGLGTTANYGHVKTINVLTQSSHIDGTALSAYQGYLLKQQIDSAARSVSTGIATLTDTIPASSTLTKSIPIGSNKLTGKLMMKRNSDTSFYWTSLILFSTSQTHAMGAGSDGQNRGQVYGVLNGQLDYGYPLVDAGNLKLKNAYISGSNLVLVIQNVATTAKTLATDVYWEAV